MHRVYALQGDLWVPHIRPIRNHKPDNNSFIRSSNLSDTGHNRFSYIVRQVYLTPL